MRVLSRHMPRLKQVPMGLRAILFGCLLATTLIWCVYFYPVITLFVLTVSISGLVIESKPVQRHLECLRIQRQDESICQFARSFKRRSVDPWVIRAVYQEIQDLMLTSPPIAIRKEDDLFEDLKIDWEDFEDTVKDIASRTGRSLENAKSHPLYGKVQTVGDLVEFFTTLPKG